MNKQAKLVEGKSVAVQYEDSGQSVFRTIIPIEVPDTDCRFVDVTDADQVTRTTLEQLIQDYKQYVDMSVANLFTFDEWFIRMYYQSLDGTIKQKSVDISNISIKQ